jgi:hypothetical protein
MEEGMIRLLVTSAAALVLAALPAAAPTANAQAKPGTLPPNYAQLCPAEVQKLDAAIQVIGASQSALQKAQAALQKAQSEMQAGANYPCYQSARSGLQALDAG